MTPLTTAQAGFAAALLDPDRPPPAGLHTTSPAECERRFAIHRNNVMASLVGALADTFPVLRCLVGEEFFDAMAAVFVRAHPPASPVLAHYGAGLADWLATFPPALSLPYLPDMARLEQARVVAYHAADAWPLAPEVIAAQLARPAGLPGARLGLHPSCQVLCSDHAVGPLWAAHQRDELQDDDAPAFDMDAPSAVLVLRDAADEVQVLPIRAADAAFFQALLAGQCLGQALQGAPGMDPSAALALLLRHGAIVAWQATPETA